MTLPIYTVGYGNVPLDELLDHLARWGIQVLVDVRSHPYSRHRPELSKHGLATEVRARGLRYEWWGDRLGGRPRDPACLSDGKVDYDKVRTTEAYRHGVEALLELARQCRVALMCAEERPEQCHRALLICPSLVHADVDILHITATGDIETHDQMLRRVAGGQRELFRAFPPPL